MKLVLGSGSPRRKEILEMANLPFEIRKNNYEEEIDPKIEANKLPEILAREKGLAFQEIHANEVLLTADTLVILENEALGKPKDNIEAIEILERLSGKMHHVVTGVSLRTKENISTFSETTEVYFDPISLNEIENYIDKYRPFDKAGSYGIQEGIGLTAVKEIRGCFYNVMGLPIRRVYKEIKKDYLALLQ